MFTVEATDAASATFNITLLIIAVSIIVGIIFMLAMIKSIVSPIKRLQQSALKISDGDLTEYIDIHTKDEIGQLGEAFVSMKVNLKSLFAMLIKALSMFKLLHKVFQQMLSRISLLLNK